MEQPIADEEGELLLLPPSAASRPWRLVRTAVVACAAAGCATAAVACWRLGRNLGSGEGPEEGLIADFIASEGFSCNDGPWPEDWFAMEWQTYCSKPDHRAWAMTGSCEHATWEFNHSSRLEVENATLSKCRQKSGGSKCFIFDRNGEKCEKPKPAGPVPSVVHWAPPFKGTFEVTQGPNECAPTHCHGGDNEDAVDIAMPRGTEVIAGRPGVVVRVRDGHGEGAVCEDGHFYEANLVGILVEDGTEDQYLHLSADSIRVQWGERVEVGHVLALSGNSGCSSGPHLHVHTMNPNHVNTVDMAFTIPCSHMDNKVAEHFQVWCNDANCTCNPAFCDRKTWGHSRLADWKKYCNGPNDKAWVSDLVCDRYGWWTGMPNAVALAKEQCGSNCHVRDENGHQCD